MTEIIIPHRPDGVHRERALAYVLARYAEHHPDWRVTLAECPPGPWSKGAAVMPAVESSRADVVVMADADVWCDGIGDAVEAVQRGSRWALPHLNVYRLSQEGTDAVLAGEPWGGQPLDQRPYAGIIGGGIVVAPREVMLSTPLDARFVGWG